MGAAAWPCSRIWSSTASKNSCSRSGVILERRAADPDDSGRRAACDVIGSAPSAQVIDTPVYRYGSVSVLARIDTWPYRNRCVSVPERIGTGANRRPSGAPPGSDGEQQDAEDQEHHRLDDLERHVVQVR